MADWWLAHVLVCAVGTLLVYGPLLNAPLLYDDIAAVEKNPDVNLPLTWSLFENDFWGTPLRSNFSHQSYRPLTVLTYRLTHIVLRQRLFNIVLHLINTLLFTTLVQKFAGRRVARVAGTLFCFHPIQTETVLQLVGRAELLSALLYLTCLLSPNYAISCVCTALAMICKEQGVTSLAVKAILDLLWHLRGRKDDTALWRKLLLSTSVTVGLLLVRASIAGRTPSFHELDNPARTLESPLRQINFAYIALFNIYLLLNPYRQSCDYSFRSIPLIESLSDRRVLQLAVFTMTSLAMVAALLRSSQERSSAACDELTPLDNNISNNNNNNNYTACKMTKEASRAVISAQSINPLVSLVMLFIPWVPASNLVFYVGFVVAERVLYLPAMGLCFLIAIGYERLNAAIPERSSVPRNVLVALCCVMLMRSAVRGQQWRSAVHLFGSAVREYPGNIKMWNNLGKAFEMEGDFHHALNCFDRSLKQHDDIRAHWYKARLLAKLNKNELARITYQDKYPEIEAALRDVRGVRKEDVMFVVDYIRLLIKMDALEDAERLVASTVAGSPDVAELHIAAGELFYQLDKKSLAEDSYRKALEIDPRVADVYYNLGVLLMERGSTDRAASMFRRCIELNPTHEPSRVNLNVLKTNTEDDSMMSLYKEAMDAIREGSYTAAESLLHRVLSRQPHHPSALYNLALLHTQLGRPASSSLAFLDRLLADRPTHSKALLLKANIVHRQLGDTDSAVKLYAQAYTVDRSLESPLEALCDLSPRTAFSLGGSCHRDVDVEVLPQHQQSSQAEQVSQRTGAHLTGENSDRPNFYRRSVHDA